ncbi:MAG: hypothetical protein ACUVXI_07215 [bacterium]
MAEKSRDICPHIAKNLPHFGSLDELVEFFDSHDLGEYWDQMPEVDFEVDIKLSALDSV